MQLSNHAISAIVGGILGVGGSASYLLPKINELNNQIAMRPPILVVDMAKLAIEAVPVGAGEEAIQEHFRNTQTVINRFTSAGFLILSRETVISSPHDLMLNQDDLPANKLIKHQDGADRHGSDSPVE